MTTISLTTAGGASVTHDLGALLSPALREQTRIEANRWIKSLRLAPYGGATMRQRFRYRDDSLWWFTELYLHKMRQLDAAVSVVLALEAACDAASPARLQVVSTDQAIRDAAVAFAAHRRVPIDSVGDDEPSKSLAWRSFQIGLAARLSRLRPSVTVSPSRPVAAFVHTAFWRTVGAVDGPQQESYIGAVLDALAATTGDAGLFCVGVGPRRNFRARRWWDPMTASAAHSRLITPVERLAPRAAIAGSLDVWRRREQLARDLTAGDGIRSAATFRGCDLWPVLRRELEAVAMLQWPWSARAMDEAGAALDAIAPAVAVTYAEAGGWGRALVLEARRRGIPVAGVQHGFIYRHWLNYLHDADELVADGADRGCPIPDRTLLFDGYARRHLIDAGHFPPDSLDVTGNARLDELAERCAALRPLRDALRRELGASDASQPLAVLAAKLSEIKPVLPDLVEALRGLPGTRLLIKPHPAETRDGYAPYVNGVPNISVAEVTSDLSRLLTAADVVITMNSTVAIDGIALGLPALVVGLPNNLSPFVEAGAMLGADGAEGIRRALQSVLYDAEVRRAITAAGAAFAREHALASDGRAARRSADAILALAGRPTRERPHAEGS